MTLLNQTGHPHDQAIRANAAAAIADLQAETGIPPSSHLPARKEIRAVPVGGRADSAIRILLGRKG